jgi:tetratricopeptide (TPR) repeat protein
VATHVKHLIKIGVVHYRQQQYDEALNVWKQAQALDPTNEQLTARIKRVTRVTEKLQNLRTKGGAPQ